MSWICPSEINGRCKRIDKVCHPGMEGCILGNRFKFLEFNATDYKVKEKGK